MKLNGHSLPQKTPIILVGAAGASGIQLNIKVKMKIQIHNSNDTKIAEVISEVNIINKFEDGLDLLGDLYYQGFDKIIVHKKNITHDFFDLKTGLAGEILQKFSTYRVRLAIVGDFSIYTSKSLNDFIFESNKGRQVNFVSTCTDAINILSNR